LKKDEHLSQLGMVGDLEILRDEISHILLLAQALPPDLRLELGNLHIRISKILSAISEDINGTPKSPLVA